MIIDDLYKILINSVYYFPNSDKKCLQPQTFAVLDSLQNINTENLGKTVSDKNKPYFYSRLWEALKFRPSQIKFDYPALYVFETSVSVTGLFSNENKSCHNLQILVVDSYKEDMCQKGLAANDCEGRTVNEIYRDTEYVLFHVLEYLNDIVVTNEGRAYNRLHFNYLVSEALITETINEALSISFTNGLRRGNTNASAFRWEGKGADNLYGTAINLNVCVNKCYDAEFNFDKIKTPQGIDKGCC